jgi:hypothetical protein
MARFAIQRKLSLAASPHSVGLPNKKPLITQGLKLAGGNGEHSVMVSEGM